MLNSVKEQANMYNTTDNANLSFYGHVLISDADTGEVLLDKYNAINFENMAIAIAGLLGQQDDSGNGFHIGKMRFGTGGTNIDSNGNITYNTPKTSGTDTTLYNETVGSASRFEKLLTPGDFEVSTQTGQTYRDLTSICILQYNEQELVDAGQPASDNGANFEDFVFDELALVGDNDALLTHLIFHPIQKSQNRKLEIRYTLRITAGS